MAAVPLMALAVAWHFHTKKHQFRKIGKEEVVRKMIPGYSRTYQLIRFIIFLLAFTLIITAIANPRTSSTMENVERKGTDVLVALDVSKSMLADDVIPNRLELAKSYLYDLFKASSNDRIGMIVFAGKPYLQMPLSTDHSAAYMYLRYAGPDMIPSQGTVLSEVMQMAIQAFNSKERTYKTLILVTDGEAHDPEAEEVARQLKENGIMVITVGIGTPGGTRVIDPLTGAPKRDNTGNVVISQLNERLLAQIAAQTNGKYIYLNDVDKAVEVTREMLNGVEDIIIEDQAFMSYTNYFQWLIALGVILLIIEFVFPERKFEK